MGSGVEVELHVPDFAPVKEFYGALGFDVVWANETADTSAYLVMRNGGVVLRFWPGNDTVKHHSFFVRFPAQSARGVGVEIVIAVDDLDSVYGSAQSLRAVVSEMNVRPWGLRDFRVVDPFGYFLRFTEHHDVTAPDYAGRPAPETPLNE